MLTPSLVLLMLLPAAAHVDEGLGCLLGPCQLQCSGDKYDQPVCGSDGNTYPSQ
jgi:hypothetical protein